MPVLDGFEFVKRYFMFVFSFSSPLKYPKNPRYRSFERAEKIQGALIGKPDRATLQIVCMSANSDQETQQLALSFGMDAFIEKPFKFEKLAPYLVRRKNEAQNTGD
jgi:CheY-like chemotaxis protein